MALGWPSVEWGLAHITSRELTEWNVYEQLTGPIGPQREDYHFARMMWLISNMMRGQDSDMIPLADFMPFVEHDDAPVLAASQQHPSVAMFERMYAEFHKGE